MNTVFIKNGFYRNLPVLNTRFNLVDGPKQGAKGMYVTVRNDGNFAVDIDKVKIKIDTPADIQIEGDEVINSMFEVVGESTPQETEEEAMDRIASRFEILDEMAAAVIAGDVRAMIVSGPPGVGKSFGVEAQLQKYNLLNQIAGKQARYNVVKGATTALGLYIQLYKYSDKGNILVFDDCDSVFADELSLNIMKAALDSGKRRRICWNTDSRLLRDEGIPNSFDFKGSAIFITNLKFENVRSKKLQDHLEALESRCHFIDLTIDTERDKLLRIRQVNRDADGGLFKDYNFKNDEADQILNFMQENAGKLRELSIRMALKIADLMIVNPTKWKTLAEITCFKRR